MSHGDSQLGTPARVEAAGPGRQRAGAEPAVAGTLAIPAAFASAWTDYLAAARQLDAVRRGASTAASEQARSVQAAREELSGVRARLVLQQSRLREFGVPAISLVPSPPEVSEAARSMMSGPAAVLSELRAARTSAHTVDGILTGRRLVRPAAWSPRPRNLLVYGPLAAFVPLLQVLLVTVAEAGVLPVLALLGGLPLAAIGFAAGWIGIDRLFRPAQDAGWVDRTPGFGVLICLVPTALTTIGTGLVLLLR